MKTSFKKILAVVMTVFILVGVARPISADAAAKVFFYEKTVWLGQNTSWAIDGYITNMPDKAKLVSVKVSNKKVLSIDDCSHGETKTIHNQAVVPKKVGKSKLTIVYKVGSKKKTISATLTVKKYPFPVKALKINGKKINVKENSIHYFMDNYKKSNIKLNVTVKKGWKIFDAVLVDMGVPQPKTITKSVKNGKSIKLLKSNGQYISITLMDKNDKMITYQIFINK